MVDFKKMNLEEKEGYAKNAIVDALKKAKNPFVAFTGGKDSLVVLHLLKSTAKPFKVVQIDTSVKFPEIIDFISKMERLWNLEIIRVKNKDALKKITIAKDKMECCNLLKAVPLNDAIEKYGIDYLFTGVRWDEQKERKKELFFSERIKHVRVQPILHFTEKDIWNYIKKYNLPYCSLYARGYRSIGCVPCTILSGKGDERSGRSIEKEKLMKQLRRLGYF